MNRRDFIRRLAAVGVSSALPMSSFATETAFAKGNDGLKAVNFKQLFNQSLANDPALIGFANVQNNFSQHILTIEGRIPTDLNGTFFRNGPAKHERGEQRYHHLFEGDGMLQKFVISEGNISHEGKFINTPKFLKEEKAQQFLYSGPDTPLDSSLPVSNADTVNTANTHIFPVNDELWALWEGGSATAIEPESMAFKHHVNLGKNTHYGDKLKGLPFSAHPKIDPNGDIWNFGLNPSGHIVLYHLSPKGQLKNVRLLESGYKGGILHDFLITERHVLLILPSLVRNRDSKRLFSGAEIDKSLPMKVLVVDKNTLDHKQTYELPPGFVFHFGNAWEEKNGTIHFDASLYKDAAVLHQLSDIMAGKNAINSQNYSSAQAYTCLFSLYRNGKVEQLQLKDSSEFPRVCPHVCGLKNRYLFYISSQNQSVWSDTVIAQDLEHDKQSKFHFGSDYLVEEHIPICPTQEEGKGYLIGTALHVPSKRTCLNFFDMSQVEQGPLARAWLPYHLPLGFHGNFATLS